jgi:hypothetical protein
MRRSSVLFLMMVLLGLAAASAAQAGSSQDLQDPSAQRLEQKYFVQLQSVARGIQTHRFAYPFYLSRVLDINQQKQQRSDPHSVRFDRFKSHTVLEITGNYYASYSDKALSPGQRARQTFRDVMLPVLKVAVPPLAGDPSVQGFALEISHHVRGKVMGVSSEHAENVVLYLPSEAATRLVSATTTEQQQAALLDGLAYLDAQPITLWLSDDEPAPPPPVEKTDAARAAEVASLSGPPGSSPDTPLVSPRLVKGPDWPVRPGLNQDSLAALQTSHQDAIARMLSEMNTEAHFVSYAPPSFIAFHQGAYLQVSVDTPLEAGTTGSQYRLAALAFDQHVAHLVRPTLKYFPEAPGFDGFDFSTTIKLPGSEHSEAVEFFLPIAAMRCFAEYNCTGQQLINSGFVLINGERAALDLQMSEAAH